MKPSWSKALVSAFLLCSAVLSGCESSAPRDGDAGAKIVAADSQDQTKTTQEISANEGQLTAMRTRAENLVLRCARQWEKDPAKIESCRSRYEEVEADANAYWDMYKTKFATARLSDDLGATLTDLATSANKKFEMFRDFVTPPEDRQAGNPATILLIIEVGKQLYKVYDDAKNEKKEEAKREIFQVVDRMKFRKWDSILAVNTPKR